MRCHYPGTPLRGFLLPPEPGTYLHPLGVKVSTGEVLVVDPSQTFLGWPGVACRALAFGTQEFRGRGPHILCSELRAWSIGVTLVWAKPTTFSRTWRRPFPGPELVQTEGLSWRAESRRPLTHMAAYIPPSEPESPAVSAHGPQLPSRPPVNAWKGQGH